MGSLNGAGVDELRRADLILDQVFLRMLKLLLKMVSIRCRQLELVPPILSKFFDEVHLKLLLKKLQLLHELVRRR